jgi:stearoyl-CoA desaturase (delta-9 desaturase)
MEVEHLKSDFENSPINGTPLPSPADRLKQTQLNSQGPVSTAKAPAGQPQASMADRFTLSVPPSERLRIVHTVPSLRPGVESRRGVLKGQSRAEVNSELESLQLGTLQA